MQIWGLGLKDWSHILNSTVKSSGVETAESQTAQF